MKTTYNKLIRDKIPQITKDNKQTPITRKLGEEEFTQELLKKLEEEVKEVIKAKNNKEELMKEIGDVYEVIDEIMEDHNIKQKGGAIGFFTKGIMERKDFYMAGLTVALVPFVNEELYFE